MNANPLAAYRETRVKTASQGQLIVMLYDEAIKQADTAVALLGPESEAQGRKTSSASTCASLGKVQDVITELMASLDFDAGGDIAQGPLRPVRLVRQGNPRGQHPQGSRPHRGGAQHARGASRSLGRRRVQDAERLVHPRRRQHRRLREARHGHHHQRRHWVQGRDAQALPRAPRTAESQVRELLDRSRPRAQRHRVGRRGQDSPPTSSSRRRSSPRYSPFRRSSTHWKRYTELRTPRPGKTPRYPLCAAHSTSSRTRCSGATPRTGPCSSGRWTSSAPRSRASAIPRPPAAPSTREPAKAHWWISKADRSRPSAGGPACCEGSPLVLTEQPLG
jgi:flagellar biosynthetic protein FliS